MYGPVEIRKVGQHLLDLKTMWMALSFGKILGPTASMSGRVFTLSPPDSPLFFCEMSLNLYKTNKNGVAFVKGGCDGTEFRAHSALTLLAQASPVVAPWLLCCVVVQLLSCVVVQLLSCVVVQLPSQV